MGTFRISFTDTTYAIQGDGVNTVDSNGTYTYSATGAVGTGMLVDSISGPLTVALSYDASSTGTYSVDSPGNGSQAGTFVEL